MEIIAIIGAGVAGLAAARALQKSGKTQVVVFEKSRSVAGRCASRTWDGQRIDHGAQYFTMRDQDFREEAETLCGEQIARIDAPILTEKETILGKNEERFYHRAGNRGLGEALAEGVEVQRECLIDSIRPSSGKWLVAGQIFDAVLLTAPWPQTEKLLEIEPVPVAVAPCLTAVFAYERVWSGLAKTVYAKSWRDDDLAWSACENHKAGRILPGWTVFIAQASPDFSGKWLENEPAHWAAELRKALEDRWEIAAGDFRNQLTHRWRYARFLEKLTPPRLAPGLFLAGDALTGSRVESAWLSGREAAKAILYFLN